MLARKALAGTAGAPKVYVEDVFSTYLYTGNGSTQTITNNIDLSTEGGLVWTKKRATGADNNYLFDTARGTNKVLYSDLTNGSDTWANSLTAYNANGFSLGSGGPNTNADTYASWTFRKAKKFFDIVTYTGNSSNRTISHNLGSVPGCMIIKSTSTTYSWRVYHRSLGNTKFLTLDTTAAEDTGATLWNNTTPTSTEFTVGTASSVNSSGETYVAYLFAHDAGGFGDAGSDNVISCGSFTTDGATTTTVNLGYEPQWLMVKLSNGTSNWHIFDNMRGLVVSGNDASLSANVSSAESSADYIVPTATGFDITTSSNFNNPSQTYIYIAIRRGPMKTPTTGTSVFEPVAYTGTGATQTITTNFPVDLAQIHARSSVLSFPTFDRLRGGTQRLFTTGTSAEDASGDTSFASNTGITNSSYTNNGVTFITWNFRRAPGFFDVVCYTGTGSARTVTHNLGVAPELMIVKNRSNGAPNWQSYHSALGNTQIVQINTTNAASTASTVWNNTTPTSSVFTVGTNAGVNTSSENYVAYLFASLSGVSKIGTYTGNGSSVTVTTNFQPRFILVKRTDSTGDWIVSDSARGLVAGDDPFLKLNSTAAEVTNEDWVDITSTSFTVNQTTNNANVNTGTYIYLAIA